MSDERSLKETWEFKIKTIIQAYGECCINLSSWEESFLDSIEIQIAKGKDLSWKQSKCLNAIFEKIQ